MAVGDPVQEVEAQPGDHLAQPPQGQPVVGVGGVDQDVRAQAHALRPVEDHLQVEAVDGQGRVGVHDGRDVDALLVEVGGVQGAAGQRWPRHAHPPRPGLVVPLEDGLELVVFEDPGADVRGGLDDRVAEDDRVVPYVEGRGGPRVPVRRADVDVLARGGGPVDGDAAGGQGRGQALDVLVELVDVLLRDRKERLAGRGVGRDVVEVEQLEGGIDVVRGVVVGAADDDLAERAPLVEAVHGQGSGHGGPPPWRHLPSRSAAGQARAGGRPQRLGR